MRAQAADGSIHEFQDGTDIAVVDRVMKNYAAQQSSPAAVPLREARHTGFAGQVGDAFASPAPPAQAPTAAKLGQQWGDIAKGTAQGAVAGTPGVPGDIEQLGRMLLSNVAPVSRETTLPTSSGLADALFGKTSSKEQDAGRFIGNMVSPYPAKVAGSVLQKGAGQIAFHGLGLTTGAGGAAIKEAFRAGQEGGQASRVFTDQMRGAAPVSEVVRSAKEAVSQLRRDRSATYKAGIGTTIQGDPAVLDFRPIDQAIRNVSGIGVYQGKTLSQGADKVWKRIEDVVDDWRQSDPNVFHTPEGLDALKQRIGNLAHEEDLKAVAGPGTPGAIIVDEVYNAVKNQIVQQSPRYAEVMRDYMNATDEIRNIEGSLSLRNGTMLDTSIRKLQSILRNNANTNYGQRVQMGQTLAANGADNLMPQLAGQALSSPTPRGLQGAVAGGSAATAIGFGAPQMLPYLAASSPRLVGEATHLAGRLMPFAKKNPALTGRSASMAALLGAIPSSKGAALTATPQLLAQLLAESQ